MFHSYQVDEPIRQLRGIRFSLFESFYLFYFILKRNTYLPNANSVDPNQTPRFAASTQGLHYLPMSYLWDARR